ncbi:unnamed protein product [Adineta ricciae]|uniref:Shisa N-terminal domain-containing protein n=1 Tax=Adineta ricciae TaxID=249248 RepID=A0A814ALJ8_ADIRI|nr:unnamed protein product [Adineta ricciae]CAF0941052.1 unnamed protein product [Adineta ricciae]
MSKSCPGFLDRHGIWNNGFDCSSSRVCCGTETNRYCCIPSSKISLFFSSTTSLTPDQSSEDLDSYTLHTSDSLLTEKWFFIRMCTAGIFFASVLLACIIIYLCITSMRHCKRQKRMSLTQLPPSILTEPKRSLSNRISTISHASIDGKSTYTDTSIVLQTPLNIYPTNHSRNSTASSSLSSYYMYPNELEYLCK